MTMSWIWKWAPSYLAVLFLAVAAAPAQIGPVADFDYPRAASYLVMELEIVDAKMADLDRTHRIQFFGDGTVSIHRPAYDLRAGDVTARIDQAQLSQLVRATLDRGLHDFDAAALTATTRQAEADRRRAANGLVYTSEDTRHRLRLQLGSYTPAATGVTIQGFDRTVAWRNLNWHIRTYPELAALANLGATVEEIENLTTNVQSVEAGQSREVGR